MEQQTIKHQKVLNPSLNNYYIKYEKSWESSSMNHWLELDWKASHGMEKLIG